MTIRKRFDLECDQCGAVATIHGVSRREALKAFKRSGWDIGAGKIADLCPPCSRADGAA